MESKIRDLRQEIFKFEQLSNFDKNDFFVSECNYFAFNLLGIDASKLSIFSGCC